MSLAYRRFLVSQLLAPLRSTSNKASRVSQVARVSCLSTSCKSLYGSTREHSTTGHTTPNSSVRLRFAPSPTGSLHLGGLRTALFNHLLARNLGGKWILRIEDTDQTRFVPGAQEELLRCLDWAGLHYDEGPGKEGQVGPYVQSQRQDYYRETMHQLLEHDHAYHCFCPAERLEALRLEARRTKAPTHYDGHCRHLSQSEVSEKIAKGDRYVIRFRNRELPKDSVDLVYGPLSFPKLPQEDFILIKGDGMPTYHFANVVDDHAMKISHVLRGEEWIPSIPKHLALYAAFGWEAPAFAHMPILVNPDGSKLSKRSGDVKVLDYIEKGYEPEAMVNFVALMGSSWSRKDPSADVSDVMSMEEMISKFSLSNLNKHRSTMFGGKLSYLNKEHMRRKMQTSDGAANLVRRATRAVSETLGIDAQTLSEDFMRKALLLGTDRIDLVNELPQTYPYFFRQPELASKEANDLRKKLDSDTLARVLDKTISSIEDYKGPWSLEASKTIINDVSEELQIKGAKLITPLRWALTGSKSGPGVTSLLELFGPEETCHRLQQARSLKI